MQPLYQMENQSIAPLLAHLDVVSDVFVRPGPNKVQKIKDKKDRTTKQVQKDQNRIASQIQR